MKSDSERIKINKKCEKTKTKNKTKIKNKKLILQISAVMIPIIIAMMAGVLYIVYSSTVKGFLDSQNAIMMQMLTTVEKNFNYDSDMASWYFDYFEAHPNIIYERLTGEESNLPMGVFDAEDAWSVKWLERGSDQLKNYATKQYLDSLRSAAYWQTKDENYVSLFMVLTDENYEGLCLFNFEDTESDGIPEAGWKLDMSEHPAIVDAVESNADDVFFERTKEFGSEGSYYIGYKPIRIGERIRAVIGVAYSWKDFSSVMASTFNKAVALGLADMILASAVLLILLYRKAIAPVTSIQHSVNDYIETKDSDAVISRMSAVKSSNEIGRLAVNISDMVTEINRYMNDNIKLAAERERVSAELDMAKDIQAGQLPRVFPPFPERREFDIYATMTPAKEVGGDFYDFFFVDDDHLALVMADVSGKGVPAALFMMMSKMLINNYAKQGFSPAKTLEQVNEVICQNNEKEMFVTVWLGVLEISTGRLVASNAGHEYPVLRNAGGKYELFMDKHGFVVGGYEGMKYKEYEIQLEKGGSLFLYTDGVPEATNSREQLFGTERLLEVMNSSPESTPKEMLENVKSAVDSFVGDADQFDDLTMLCITLL